MMKRFIELRFRYTPSILLVLHCIMLILAWSFEGAAFFVLLAFVPVFIILNLMRPEYNTRVGIVILSFLSVFFWVFFTIYWIRPVNSIGHTINTLLASLLLYLPYVIAYYFRFRKGTSGIMSSLIFISVWIIIEVLHDINILAFPYFTIGHILAAYPDIVQWYAWIGAIGGSLWIMLVNLTSVQIFRSFIFKHRINKIRIIVGLVLLLSFPIISIFTFNGEEDHLCITDWNAMVLHTSLDVFNYKYEVPSDELLSNYIKTTQSFLNAELNNFILWPENAITGDISLSNLDSSIAIRVIHDNLIHGKNSMLVAGTIVEEVVSSPDPLQYQPDYLFNSSEGYYYKLYNSAVFVSDNRPTLIKSKKRLVQFSEKIPPHKIFKPLVKLIPTLAELNFSSLDIPLGVFASKDGLIRTCPIICWGSAFSNLCASEVMETESNFMTVILNEGWMESEKAHMLFKRFSQSRAIENQRFLVKSSNKGYSAIISPNGKIVEEQYTDHDCVLQARIVTNDRFPFYTRNHSLISFLLIFLSSSIILVEVIKKRMHRKI